MMSFVAENALFLVYFSSALFVLVIAVCWGSDHKVNAASLLLASILLTNIFYRLVVIHVIPPQIVNLLFALIDLFLFWVFIGIARKPTNYERNYWAGVLAFLQFFMLSVNLVGSVNAPFTRSLEFVLTLNGLTIAALVTCFISFMPKSWNEATGVLKAKWLYFKADILDRLFRQKATALSAGAGARNPSADALHAKIGERIRDARLQRALEPDDLGDFLGVSAAEAKAYEAGDKRLSATALHALAKHLGTKLRDFHGGLVVDGPALRRTTRAAGN